MSKLIGAVSNAFGAEHSPPSSTFLIGVTVIATLATITATRLIYQAEKVRIIKSPAVTLLPRLSIAEKEALPYPPDALPGARDVDSPYGTTRVYEWGPEEGRKVLLLHGITTPSLALGAVAHGLVEKGCRVMLFDGWGRGYSDTPADLPHDDRLFSSQILIALTSSPLSWTGGPDGDFHLIGYSLGGSIALCFTSHFPNMVKSLVLFAPAGLIRASRIGLQRYASQLFSLIPRPILDAHLKQKLQRPLFPRENKDDFITSDIAEPTPALAPASLRYPSIDVLSATKWAIANHDGFITSFKSMVLHAPTGNQEAAWKRISTQDRKIIIVCATKDPIIDPEELRPDLERILEGGRCEVEWKVIEGAAHDFVGTDTSKVVDFVSDYWGL